MLETGIMLGGRYEILKRIGSGGMSDVYMAKDHKLNRNVAVKVLKKEYVEDETFLKRFEAEAQSVAGLAHPNIVNIFDVGQEDGRSYIVMELAEGMTLKEYIQKKGRLSSKETVNIAMQIVAAIGCAHQNHVIHRDIKPQNILLAENGTVKVADFGIAKAANSNTVTSTAIGSVHYISPEQAKGMYCDEKSDIYSLGITMYEMVTGEVPFDHENGVTVALMHLQNEMIPPRELAEDIPESLEKIILKCTMKKPEERYQSAEELQEDLNLVFKDTAGSFVGVIPVIDNAPTTMIDQKELKEQLDASAGGGQEGTEDEDEEEEGGMNSKIERLVIILAALVGSIILIAVIAFVLQNSGMLKSGESTTAKSSAGTTTAKKVTTEQKNEQVTVENVVGLSRSRAVELIGNELTVKTKEESSSTYDEGTVMYQSLEAGTKVDVGTSIILTVSSGVKKYTVPEVVGLSQTRATKRLTNFNVSVTTKYSSSVEEGNVISQTPAGGSRRSKGSTVTIVVSKGSQLIRVPSVEGLSQSSAKAELSAAGLKSSVSKRYSSSVSDGDVISQTISSGTRVSKGTVVGIVVSLGPKATTSKPSTTETTTEKVTSTTTETATTP